MITVPALFKKEKTTKDIKIRFLTLKEKMTPKRGILINKIQIVNPNATEGTKILAEGGSNILALLEHQSRTFQEITEGRELIKALPPNCEFSREKIDTEPRN